MNSAQGGTDWVFPCSYTNFVCVLATSEDVGTGMVYIWQKSLTSCRPTYNSAAGSWSPLLNIMLLAIGE